MMGGGDQCHAWISFFEEAGIGQPEATNYAIVFTENRMRLAEAHLADLNKEYLSDMNVKAIGDVMAILKHARVIHDKLMRQKVSTPLKLVREVPPVLSASTQSTSAPSHQPPPAATSASQVKVNANKTTRKVLNINRATVKRPEEDKGAYTIVLPHSLARTQQTKAQTHPNKIETQERKILPIASQPKSAPSTIQKPAPSLLAESNNTVKSIFDRLKPPPGVPTSAPGPKITLTRISTSSVKREGSGAGQGRAQVTTTVKRAADTSGMKGDDDGGAKVARGTLAAQTKRSSSPSFVINLPSSLPSFTTEVESANPAKAPSSSNKTIQLKPKITPITMSSADSTSSRPIGNGLKLKKTEGILRADSKVGGNAASVRERITAPESSGERGNWSSRRGFPVRGGRGGRGFRGARFGRGGVYNRLG